MWVLRIRLAGFSEPTLFFLPFSLLFQNYSLPLQRCNANSSTIMVTQKETREKNRASHENLGKFFYDLAKTSFTAMVAADVVSFFMTNADPIALAVLLAVGIFVTSVFAYLGYYIIKK